MSTDYSFAQKKPEKLILEENILSDTAVLKTQLFRIIKTDRKRMRITLIFLGIALSLNTKNTYLKDKINCRNINDTEHDTVNFDLV